MHAFFLCGFILTLRFRLSLKVRWFIQVSVHSRGWTLIKSIPSCLMNTYLINATRSSTLMGLFVLSISILSICRFNESCLVHVAGQAALVTPPDCMFKLMKPGEARLKRTKPFALKTGHCFFPFLNLFSFQPPRFPLFPP